MRVTIRIHSAFWKLSKALGARSGGQFFTTESSRSKPNPVPTRLYHRDRSDTDHATGAFFDCKGSMRMPRKAKAIVTSGFKMLKKQYGRKAVVATPRVAAI